MGTAGALDYRPVSSCMNRRARIGTHRSKVAQSFANDTHSSSRLRLPAELLGGWLAFYSANEARRLAPIPATWPTMSDADLAAAVARARLLTPFPALSDERRE